MTTSATPALNRINYNQQRLREMRRPEYFTELASKPKDLPADQAATVAAAGAIADRIFKDAKREALGAVLLAYYDSKKDGSTYDVETIVRETALRVAQKMGA